MASILSPSRLARRSAAHPWRVVAAWAVALVVSIAIIATLLAGALTTQQGFVSNPESKQAATGIEQRQGTAERIVETVVIEPASPAAQAAVVAAVQKEAAVGSAQVGPVSADSALVQIVLKGDREDRRRRGRARHRRRPGRRRGAAAHPPGSPARRRSTATSRRWPSPTSPRASRSASRWR